MEEKHVNRTIKQSAQNLIWKKIRNGIFDWREIRGNSGRCFVISDACRCGIRFGLSTSKDVEEQNSELKGSQTSKLSDSELEILLISLVCQIDLIQPQRSD
jgi:hypothetical protein